MTLKGRPNAEADTLDGFIYHESEHEDRKGSDTLVVRLALNDSAPWMIKLQRRRGLDHPKRHYLGAKALRLCLEGEV